jgi:hypothetical protein
MIAGRFEDRDISRCTFGGSIVLASKEAVEWQPPPHPMTDFMPLNYSLKMKTRFWPEKRTSFTCPFSPNSTAS